jgi:xylitol oxidase
VAFSRRENPTEFAGVVVNLGALGVVTKLTLAIEPTYLVAQFVLENLSFASIDGNFDTIMASATSVSLFTDWQAERFHQWWWKQRANASTDEKPLLFGFFKVPESKVHRDAPASAEPVNRVFQPAPGSSWHDVESKCFFGATPALKPVHPLPSMPAENCTERFPGAWHERLPHFRLEFTPSSGAELQSEYFVPRVHAVPALRALFRMRTEIAPHIHVSEVRTIAADDLWLSPCHRQACVGIHFTWKPDWPAVRQLLPRIEEALAPFEARPHWGKLFAMAPERLRSLYP